MSDEVRVTVEPVAEGGYRAIDERGDQIAIDVPVAAGGLAGAWQPTALLLAALGGCLAIDMGIVLRKQGYDPGDYRVTVAGARASTPGRPFAEMEATHSWSGNIPDEVVRRAVALVDERYCTVGITLKHGVPIHHEVSR
jgi:putative redox protein